MNHVVDTIGRIIRVDEFQDAWQLSSDFDINEINNFKFK